MTRSGKALGAIGLCGLLLITTVAEAEPPNACAGLFDSAKGDWESSEAHVNVEMSEEKSACFLVPRSVTDKSLREYYGAGKSLILSFDPDDLFNYINGKAAIRVGAGERAVDAGQIDCLADPTPGAVAIMEAPTPAPATVAGTKSSLLAMNLPFDEASSDLPGYRRYVSEHGGYRAEYYFPDSGDDAVLAFWCGPLSGIEVCNIQGDYYGMTAAIRYLKPDMSRVKPERALQCVRALGDLFRVK